MQTHPTHMSFYLSKLLVVLSLDFYVTIADEGLNPFLLPPPQPAMSLCFWVTFCSPKASLEPASFYFVCLHRSIMHPDPAKLPFSCLWLHTSAVTKATTFSTKHYLLIPVRYKAFRTKSNSHTQAKCMGIKCIFINLHPFIL